MLRTIAVVIAIVLYIIVVALPFLLYALITRDDERLYRMGVVGVRLVLWAGGVRIETEGRQNMDPKRTAVFMANHVSNADPLVLVACLPRVAALAKHSVFRIPVVGQAMRLAGFIPVVRGTKQAAVSVEAGVRALQAGRSLMVFPEGTRSFTDEMLPFRRGVFLMSLRAGVSIVPVTIIGSREVMRKGDPSIHPGMVRVVIHQPIETAGVREDERHALAEQIREQIASALPPAHATGQRRDAEDAEENGTP